MMRKTAREIMTGQAECIGENETVVTAAEKMARLDVGSLPICGEDDRLKGMLTDRDIVVKVLGVVGQGDLATALGREQVGELVEAISA
jgi:CBS domain-containing protein